MMALKKLLAAALASSLSFAAMAQTPAEPAKPAEPAPAKPAEDTMKVTPYGFILLNTYWDTDTFTTKDYPGQISTANDGGSFLMSARQSRVGLRLAGKDTLVTGADLSGVVEFDFKAGHIPTSFTTRASAATPPVFTTTSTVPSTAWYNGVMRLRLAAGTATWKFGTNSFAILAGQDYGLVNPLFAESLAWVADPLFWQAGNAWRRSPQIRATYNGTFGGVGVQVAAAMLSPEDFSAPVDFGAGNRARQPDLEARVALSYKASPDMNGTVGASYHTNKRRYVTSAAGAATTTTDDVTTDGYGFDAEINVPFLTVKGEYYNFTGLDDTYNGIFTTTTGVSGGAIKAAGSDGYWVQGVIKPIPAVWLTVGYGQANADKGDLRSIGAAASTRVENSQLEGGIIVNAGKWWRFGVEAMKVETKTLGSATVAAAKDDGMQIALSSMLKF